MRKIKKFWNGIQNIILKKSILSPNLTFWPSSDLGKSFPEGNIYIVRSVLLLSNFMQNIEKFWRAVQKQSLKKSNFGPNLIFWPRPQGVKSFFENRKTSLFYIHAVLTLCKISKTSGARVLRYQRYGRTDGRSWIYRTLSAKAVGPKRIHKFKYLKVLQTRIYKWVKVVKNGPSKIYGRLPLKNSKWYVLPEADHITSNFLKAIFHKFYLVHSWIPWPKWTLKIWFPMIHKPRQKYIMILWCFFLKLVSAIFIKFLFFSPNDSPSKTMKNVFYFI